MSADNEIVALKSLGISPRVMLYPAFLLAVVISLGMIWLNDVANTWGSTGMQSVVFNSVEEVVFRKLRTERTFRNDHFVINVKQVQDRKMIEPRLEVRGKNPIVVEASQAELITDLKAEKLQILLTDCTMERGNEIFAYPGTYPYEFPLSMATLKDRSALSVSELGLGLISDELVAQQAAIQAMEQRLAARAAFQMVLGEFHQLAAKNKHPDSENWNKLHRDYQAAKSRLNRLHLEPWRRCAEGFSCLFIVMVGAPLAIHMRTTNFFTTFAMCFFPVLCIYYPALMWAVNRVKDGAIPPYSVWIGNGILLLASIWLTRKILRY